MRIFPQYGRLAPLTFDLFDIEHPFTEAEIWEAVEQLPAGKAPGPMGLPQCFLHACWVVIKVDIYGAFDKLFHLQL